MGWGKLPGCYFRDWPRQPTLMLRTMTSSLQLVREQFPPLRDRVVSLFDGDPVFRELCEDYEACTDALARQPASAGLRQEYATLQLRIETELLGFLNADADNPGRRM